MNNTCPICFEDLIDKSRATPDVCDHIFCFSCLKKWSKHGSYCPVDRKRFRKIVNLDSEAVIQIKPCRPKQTRVLYDITVYCEVCKKSNNASTLLLCDCCDLGYHCKCLQPPLQEVPPGVWYCPVCVGVETKIKKSKDPKAVQKGNAAQSNQEDLPSKSSLNSCSTQSQTNRFRSEGRASSQEQSSETTTDLTSLMTDNRKNYINDETIKSADNFLVSETEVAESVKRNYLSAATSNVKYSLTTQISIKSPKNKDQENISSCSRRLRNRDPGLKSNETSYSLVTGQSDSKKEQLISKKGIKETSLIKDYQYDVCPLSKTSDVENNSNETKGINLKPENNSSLSIKLKNEGGRLNTNKIKSYSCRSSKRIKQNKSYVCPSKANSLRIQSKANSLRIQNNGAYSGVNESPKNHVKSDYLSNTSRQSTSNATERFQLNNPELIKNNSAFSIQKNSYKGHENITKSTTSGCEFSVDQFKTTIRSPRNIHDDENKDSVCVLSVVSDIRKNKMLKTLGSKIKGGKGLINLNTVNTTDIGTSPQININNVIVPNRKESEEQPVNKKIVQPNTEGLNKKDQDPNRELQDREVTTATIETNFENTDWCIHYCQKPDNYSVSKDLKTNKLCNKECFTTFQTNARNKSSILCSAEEFLETNMILTNQNKKEYCRNVQSISVDVKNDIPSIDSNISKSETLVYKVSEDSERKGASLSLYNLKNYLIKDSKKNNEINIDGYLSATETGVLIHPESSESAKYYFLTKKSISDFAIKKLSLLTSGKNERSKNKTGHSWYHVKKQDPPTCNDKVHEKSIHSTVVVSALSATTGKYKEPPSKNKPGLGWYHMAEQDPAICNNDISEKSEELSKNKPGLRWYHIEEQAPAICNDDISDKNIHSTVFTTLSDTSEELSKIKTGQSSYCKNKKDPALCNKDIPEKSIHSTIFTALSSTSKKNKEPSKNKIVQGWHHIEEQDPTIYNSKISEKSIHSKIIPEGNKINSVKPALCANISKIKKCTLKNAQETWDNISNFKSIDEDPITSPKFSVFESIDKTCESRQKYLNMNMAVTNTSLGGSKNPLSLLANTSEGDSSDMKTANLPVNPSKSYRSREVHYAIKAKMSLADELLKIEKEKWPRSFKKYKHRRSSDSISLKNREREVCESKLKNSNET